jgi:hypothetical protein
MNGSALEMIAHVIPRRWFQWVAILLFTAIAAYVFRPQMSHKYGRESRFRISVVALAIAVIGGIAWGIRLGWLSDDAFISFRYADNLVRGYGLVFNVGEYVEGYTNFLWTMLMAGVIALGIDPGQGSIIITLICFGLLIVIVWRLSFLLAPSDEAPIASIAGILVAANYILASFSTSGLETMAAAMLAVLALERALSRAPMTSGLVGIAATMTHPDQAILYVTLGMALASTREYRAGFIRYATPFFLIYLPYFLWRWNYYGDFFPNTYYAKSAGLSYFSQGNLYIVTFFFGSGFWASTPLILYGVYQYRHSLFGRYIILSVPLFLFYIAKIGGDFMYGRLLSSIIAPLLLATEIGALDLYRKHRYRLSVLAFFLLSITAIPVRLIGPSELKWGISDERSYYRLKSFTPIAIDSISFDWAQYFKRYFVDRGLRPTLGIHRVGIIGYVTRLPIVDLFGITNRDIGHRPIAKRGRPGHEKHATPEYIINSGVDISDTVTFPEPYPQWSALKLGKTFFHQVHFDPAITRALRGQRGVTTANIERRLDTYIDRLSSNNDAEQLACDAWFFEEFFLLRVGQSEKRRALERRQLELSIPSRIDSAQLSVPNDFRRSHYPDAKTAMHFNPEDESSFDITGTAFKDTPIFRLPTWRGDVARNEGSFLSTDHPRQGDYPIVSLISKPFALVGDVMELTMAGGRKSKTERVALVIDDEPVYTATGCDTNIIGQRLWFIKPYKGKMARLEIIDGERSANGHMIVDEIVQWVSSPTTYPENAEEGRPVPLFR